MRRGTNYRNRTKPNGLFKSLWKFAGENKAVTVLGAMFVIGVALGVSVARTLDDDTLTILLSLIGNFARARQSQALAQTLVSSLGRNLIFLVLLFFCGYCAISAPVIYLVPLFHGLGYGISTGAILANMGLRAMPYITFLLFPGTLLSALVLVAACDEALRMSRSFLSVIRPNTLQRGERAPTSGKYCLKFAILFFALVGGALVESYSFIFGSGLFGL